MAEASRQSRDSTAEERRESILDAALIEFAAKGLHGTSTEDMARRAGISQPYVFRLFGTKKKLFAEVLPALHARGSPRQWRTRPRASRARRRSQAMGEAYIELLEADPRATDAQMQMYAACDEPEIREVAQEGYGELVRFVGRGKRGIGQPRSRTFLRERDADQRDRRNGRQAMPESTGPTGWSGLEEDA